MKEIGSHVKDERPISSLGVGIYVVNSQRKFSITYTIVRKYRTFCLGLYKPGVGSVVLLGWLPYTTFP